MENEIYVPGDPDRCPVAPECCDECDFFLECYPDWKQVIADAMPEMQ